MGGWGWGGVAMCVLYYRVISISIKHLYTYIYLQSPVAFFFGPFAKGRFFQSFSSKNVSALQKMRTTHRSAVVCSILFMALALETCLGFNLALHQVGIQLW